MLTRILTGVILAPLVVWLFLAGPSEARIAVLVVASALCLWELGTMALADFPLDRWVIVAVGTAFVVAGALRPGHHPLDWAVAIAIPAFAVLLRPLPIDRAAYRLFAAWGAIVYIGIPLTLTVQLAVAPQPWVLYALGAVWMGDTLAYFAGRAFGRHPLHPTVSPKKTIEGAIGGLAGSIIGGVAMVVLLDLPIELVPAGLIALGAGAVAQAGDLAESLVKRAVGVKDSGAILPGHGGMLDRIDGVIFAMPVFAASLPL
jgi:phosphatidate cytidylyltransferase